MSDRTMLLDLLDAVGKQEHNVTALATPERKETFGFRLNQPMWDLAGLIRSQLEQQEPH